MSCCDRLYPKTLKVTFGGVESIYIPLPDEERLKDCLQKSLWELGVECAGHYHDPTRRSAGDLGTDLATLLFHKLRLGE